MVKLVPLSVVIGVVLAIALPTAVGREHSLEGNLQVGVGPLGEVEEQTLIPNNEDELIRSMASKKTTVIIGEHGDLQKQFTRQPQVAASDARAPVLEEASLFVRTETVLDTGDEGTTRYWIMGTLVSCALVLLCYTSGFQLPSALTSRLLAASGETGTNAEGDTSSSVGVQRSSSYISNMPKSDCAQIAEGIAQAGPIEEIAMSPNDAVVTDSSQFNSAQKLGAVTEAHAPSTLAGERPEGECDRDAQTPADPDGESAEHDDGPDLAKGTAVRDKGTSGRGSPRGPPQGAIAASLGVKGQDLKHAQTTALSPVKSRRDASNPPRPKWNRAKTTEKPPPDKPQPNAAQKTAAAPEAQPPNPDRGKGKSGRGKSGRGTAASQGAKGRGLKHAETTALSPVKPRQDASNSPRTGWNRAKATEKPPIDKPQPNAAQKTPAAPEAQPPSAFCMAKPFAESVGVDELAKPEEGSDLVTEGAELHPASLL